MACVKDVVLMRVRIGEERSISEYSVGGSESNEGQVGRLKVEH